MFCLFTSPSFAISNKELNNLFLNENYTTIIVEIPELMYQPEMWNKIYENVSYINNFKTLQEVSSTTRLRGKSISQIAKTFDGYVYANSPNYSYSKIILPKENYENITETFRLLGFKVSDNVWISPLLNQSKSAINLPYQYDTESQTLTLTGNGRTIAIIDSGIDNTHKDFSNKIIFWNDTSTQALPCCVDNYGHGTHLASIATGTGTASNGKYSGVASGANLMMWKASIGSMYDISWITESVRQAIKRKPDVISMSLGYSAGQIERYGYTIEQACKGETTGVLREVYDAVISSINNNIPIVIAAGNDGPSDKTINFPACINGAIAVGATLKKDYNKIGDNFIMWSNSPLPIDTAIKYFVNITTENRTPISGAYGGSRTDWSGFQIVFQPNIWPATIDVWVEGENRYRNCYWTSEDIKWDPGGPESGDEYWHWTQTFSSGPYIVVELFNKPHINEWPCLDFYGGWHHYYTQDSIYVNIFRTNALTTKGLVTYYSSRGPAPQDSNLIKPDVTAPGDDICAANSSQITLAEPVGEAICDNSNYQAISGTSVATPHVAGLVALLKEANPKASYNDVIEALKKTNEKILTSSPDNIEGYGSIDGIKSVDYITNCALKSSYNTGDFGDNPLIAGGCYDYNAWSGGFCTGTQYNEYCSGNYVFEYFASGTTCLGYWKNCWDYGSLYYCFNGRCVYGGSTSSIGGGGGGMPHPR